MPVLATNFEGIRELVHDNINQWETSTESGLLPVTLNGYFGPFMIWDDDFDMTIEA